MKQEILYKAEFDKRSVSMGIFSAAYMGRLIHAVANMVDIAIVQETGDDEGESENEQLSDIDEDICRDNAKLCAEGQGLRCDSVLYM